MKPCPFCEAQLSNTAKKCRHCGEWIEAPDMPGDEERRLRALERASLSVPPLPGGSENRGNASAHASTSTVVNIQPEESVIFAVITLLCFIFFWPVGFLLDLVGLLTGPKRGCFVAMLFCFVLVPGAAIFALAASGAAVGFPLVDRIVLAVRGWLHSNGWL